MASEARGAEPWLLQWATALPRPSRDDALEVLDVATLADAAAREASWSR